MDNLEYDLTKLEMYKSESVWKIDNHYLEDAKDDNEVAKLFEEIKKTDEKHMKSLREALAKRIA